MVDFKYIKTIIEIKFYDIITHVIMNEINELRIFLIDDTYIDLWYSLQIPGRYSYHWEREMKDKTIYRHDNVPHKNWKHIKTFPQHFHNGSKQHVVESYIEQNIEKGIITFLQFAHKKLTSPGSL
jgi:hypothetical protein